jgi:hypothetical protein
MTSRRRREQIHRENEQRYIKHVEEILGACGLVEVGDSVAGGRTFYFPEVVSIDPGPPETFVIRMLPGQTPDDFAAHGTAIGYDLGGSDIRVTDLGVPLISLEVVPRQADQNIV